MQPARERGSLFGFCWVAGWLLLSALGCVTSARQIGATFDEPIYVTEGLHRWRSGSSAGLMKLGTMPLPVDVQTLPLYLWEQWRGRPIDPVGELHLVLPFARAATLLFWGLLLYHAWLAGSALAGRRAEALAVAALACEPVLAAHAALATTDVAVTACLLALLYHFRASRDGGWGWRVAWPALWFALAVLAKASGMVFGALGLFLIEGQRCGWWLRSGVRGQGSGVRGQGSGVREDRTGQPSAVPGFFTSLKELFQIGLLGMLLVFVYCGSDWQPQASFLAWTKKLPDSPGSAALAWLAEHLRLFSNAGDGIMRQVTHNIRGHGSFLLGHTDRRALWYYFPVVLSIKLSVPLLLAPALLVVLNLRRWRRPWDGNWALLCAGPAVVQLDVPRPDRRPLHVSAGGPGGGGTVGRAGADGAILAVAAGTQGTGRRRRRRGDVDGHAGAGRLAGRAVLCQPALGGHRKRLPPGERGQLRLGPGVEATRAGSGNSGRTNCASGTSAPTRTSAGWRYDRCRSICCPSTRRLIFCALSAAAGWPLA